MMTGKELREKTVAELEQLNVELHQEHFNLRMQMATTQLNKNHLLKVARRNIARVKAVVNEKR